jgi:hypothetical protein
MTATIIWLLFMATDFSMTPHNGSPVGAYHSQSACLLAAAELSTAFQKDNTDTQLRLEYECRKIELLECSKSAPMPPRDQIPFWKLGCADFLDEMRKK